MAPLPERIDREVARRELGCDSGREGARYKVGEGGGALWMTKLAHQGGEREEGEGEKAPVSEEVGEKVGERYKGGEERENIDWGKREWRVWILQSFL